MALRDRSEVYRFDAFQLDPVRGAVIGPSGVELRLRPKAFALLRHLLDNPGRLLGREELLDALWPGLAVSDDSLTQCVGDLRKAFGDRAAYVLRTVPKRGYVLTAEVRQDDPPRLEVRLHPAHASTPVRDLAVLRRETMAVHRFEAPDEDRACVLLADGLASDLIAFLTCLEGLRVLPVTDAIDEEGYRVRGDVRTAGAQVRVTVRLEEAATGIALWAEQLDQPRDGPPGLFMTALTALTIHLGQQVDRHTLAAARRKPVAALSARELHLIGREHHQRGTETDTQVAKEMFALAIAADPDYAQAYAWQAYTVHRAITHGWGNPGGQAARDESLRLARRAVQIDPTAPLCLSRLAFSLVLHQRWEEAVAVAHTALNSDRPAFAAARNTCCEVLTAAGHPEEAAAIAAGTLALDPLRPPITHALLGRALLLAGKAEEALPPLRWCASHLPDYAPTYDSLMVAAVESGRLSEALAARSELLRLQPGWEPRNHTGLWFFRRPEDLDRFQAAHRRVAELAGAADEQQAVPAMEAPLPGTGQPPPHPGSPVSWPGNGGGLANLRQDTLVMYALQAALGDAAAAHAAAAITSELTAELVQYEDLRVVVGPDERAAQGYAMKGDVQSAGENVRAHLRLDELVTGTTVWAQRVEWPSARATGLPDGSVTALAAAIDLQIERRSLRWARQKPAKDLSAREVTLLGKEHYHRSTEAETAAARQMFTRAAALDPGYAPARAWQALAVARIAVHDWGSSGLQDTVEQAVRLARRAVELEPDSPACLASLSLSLALQDHWEDAVATARLALRTGRVAGDGARIAAGDVLAAAGHPAEAEEVLRHAIARDPHCFPIVHVVLGRALLLNGRCDEAMSELRRCLAQLPDYALGHRTLVVASVEAGLVEDACAAFKQVARLRPEWAQGSKPICWFLRRREDRERYQRAFDMVRRLDGAAKAGGLLPASTSRA